MLSRVSCFDTHDTLANVEYRIRSDIQVMSVKDYRSLFIKGGEHVVTMNDVEKSSFSPTMVAMVDIKEAVVPKRMRYRMPLPA